MENFLKENSTKIYYNNYEEKILIKDEENFKLIENYFFNKIFLLRNFIWEFLCSFKDNYERKFLMKTPCGHLFHTECLEKWMKMKNECPYCRREVPYVE